MMRYGGEHNALIVCFADIVTVYTDVVSCIPFIDRERGRKITQRNHAVGVGTFR